MKCSLDVDDRQTSILQISVCLTQKMFLYHVLILHPVDSSVLATREHILPVVDSHGNIATDTEELCTRVQSVLSVSFDLNFLRREAEHLFDFYYASSLLIFEIPNGEPLNTSDAFKWVPMSKADEIGVEPFRDSVVSYLKKYKDVGPNVHSERLWPYSHAGWFAQACEWMKQNIQSFANEKVKDVFKVSSGSSGCVLCARTTFSSRFYLKAVLEGTHDEVRVASALSKFMPRHFRKPLAVEENKRWMLMADYGKAMCKENCSMESNLRLVHQVLTKWASIQKESVAVAHDLSRAGVAVYGVQQLKDKLERIVSDPAWYEAQLNEIRRLEWKEYKEGEYKSKFLSYALGVLDKISKLQIPLALVHGDMNPVNIVQKGNGDFTFFDFEGTMISFPFLDALSFGFVCNNYRPVTYDDLAVYFEQWCCYEHPERMREAFTLMKEVKYLFGICLRYDMWNCAEECGRLDSMQEMGNPVSDLFD